MVNECSTSYTSKRVYGWLADDVENDPIMNYASSTRELPTKFIQKPELGSNTILEIPDFKRINKIALFTIMWGAISKLNEKVEEQQTKITTLEDEIESIKVILENNNLI